MGSTAAKSQTFDLLAKILCDDLGLDSKMKQEKKPTKDITIELFEKLIVVNPWLQKNSEYDKNLASFATAINNMETSFPHKVLENCKNDIGIAYTKMQGYISEINKDQSDPTKLAAIIEINLALLRTKPNLAYDILASIFLKSLR